MPEAARVEFSESYAKHLLEVFRGILALTRETHVKQLEFPAPTHTFPGRPRVQPLIILPNLSAEPIVSYYRRRAKGYSFVREVLAKHFGEEALARMHRLQSGTGAS